MVLGSNDYGLVGDFYFRIYSEHYGVDSGTEYYRFRLGGLRQRQGARLRDHPRRRGAWASP